MIDDIAGSRFWEWHNKHHPFAFDESLRQEALDVLIASVNAGEITSLDGIDSPMSRRIKAFHGCDEIDMNSNWICSSQAWTCPCCGRDKFQISRIGSQRQIVAKLVVHHDHMGDALQTAFYSEFEAAGTNTAQVEGRRLVERMGVAFAAYEEVLVCEDCNNADTKALKLVGKPIFFSFSPGQIRQFIHSRSHSSHEIDVDAAVRLWQAAKPAYELRMKLIHEVAHAAATDSHWYEPYAYTMKPIPILSNRPGDGTILEWVSLTSLCDALGPKPTMKARNLSRWRTVASKPGRDLPKNFLAILLSNDVRAPIWKSMADSWCCPICRRSKRETVYMKDGKIIFNPNPRPARSWPAAPMICGHCTAVLMSLKSEVSEAIGSTPQDSYSIATPEELAKIIVARPHSPHSIRSAEAAALVAAVTRRLLQHQPI
jgi:hypothetical protein